MNQKQIRAAVEAMLFASGDPIGADKLAQAVQLPQLSVEAALEALRERYAREDSGLCLLHLNTRWQLATKTEWADCIRRLLDSRRAVPLGPAAMETLSPAALRERRREITMIFQQFNLLMQRSCLKNICFPMELAGVKKADAEKRARELLEVVGLPDKANAYPAQLSGGQKQRIAIARALATDPKVLLCDEATSALDPNTTHAILTLIKDINKKLGITVVVITHQMSVVEEICDHVAILDGGVVVEEGSVQEIFSNPKTPAAKRLVAPNGGSAARDLSCLLYTSPSPRDRG